MVSFSRTTASCTAASLQLLGFFHEYIEELMLVHRAEDLALLEDNAPAFTAGDAEVGILGFARSVHHAAHNRNLDRLVHGLQALFHGRRQADEVDLRPATGRTGYQGRPALPDVGGAKDLIAGLDLFH